MVGVWIAPLTVPERQGDPANSPFFGGSSTLPSEHCLSAYDDPEAGLEQ